MKPPPDEVSQPIRDCAELVLASARPPLSEPGRQPVLELLLQSTIDQPEIHALCREVPADHLPPLLFLAATQWLVRRHQDDPLARYFVLDHRPPRAPVDGEFVPRLLAFVRAHLAAYRERMTGHRYQMNEILRSGIVALAAARTCPTVLAGHPAHADLPEEPTAWVHLDLGTATGIGLLLPRLAYRYRPDDLVLGLRDAPLELTIELRGPGRPPADLRLPRIARSVGLDLEPLDLGSTDVADWIAACVPPEHSSQERFARVLELVRSGPTGFEVRRRDVTAGLRELDEELAPGVPMLVTDTYVVTFLDEASRRALHLALTAVAARRPLVWISVDPLFPVGLSGHTAATGAEAPENVLAHVRRGEFGTVVAVTWPAGKPRHEFLAVSHPSGFWLEWLA